MLWGTYGMLWGVMGHFFNVMECYGAVNVLIRFQTANDRQYAQCAHNGIFWKKN